MWHETTRDLRAVGEAASPCRAVPEVWPDALRGCPPGPGVGEFRVSLVAGLSAARAAGTPVQTDAGAPAPVVGRAEADAGETPVDGGPPGRLPDRSLDLGARGRPDSPAVRGSLPPRACLEGPDGAGLELPEARAARGGARRGRHRPVEARGMAPDKKTPPVVAPISSSSMRAGSCSSPICAGRGHPGVTPRACVTAIVATASRSAAGWPCRPSAAGWRSISAVAPGISRVSTSGRSSSTCSAICAAPWTCSGIGAKSIADGRFGRSSRLIRGCTFTSSPPMPPSSTQRSMSGPRPIGLSPTGSRTISQICGMGWIPRSADCGVPRTSSGRASTPRTCRGLGDPFHYLGKTQ
jgi:hypothetical protein